MKPADIKSENISLGARSVVVTLWAIGDEGTLEFMSFFYYALAKGKKASEALNQAMKRIYPRKWAKVERIRHRCTHYSKREDVTKHHICHITC